MEGWIELNNGLEREYLFADFKEAFAFLTKVAKLAEQHQHHPEISNVYNQVKLRLSTHDAGNNVTEKDYKLAKEINQLEG